MKIEILGSGCANCKRMYDNVIEAVKKSGMQAEVIKIESLEEIIGRGVMMTPSLFVNGEEQIAGRVPTVNEIAEILRQAP